MGEASTATSILNFFTTLRVVQRLATVLYKLNCIQQEAESDSAERFHLVHYKVQCLILIYLFLITYLFIHSFEELYALYSSQNIIRVIKSRRRWAWHVASMEDRRGVYMDWLGDVMERDHLEDLGLDGRILNGSARSGMWWVVDFIDLAQDRGRWWALVNAVMNLRVP